MIDVHKLQQFATLARMGNFTKASLELNLSQSALSRSIQSLEARLGVRLLERERGKSGVTLTVAGTDLLGRVDALLEQMRDIETSVSGSATRTLRKLSFGIGPGIASVLLSEVLRSRLVEDRDLAITVYTDTSDQMTTLLLDGEIEFYLGLPSPRRQLALIRRRRFASFTPSFYVRSGHPLTAQEVVTADEVARYPLISFTAWNESLVSLGEDLDNYLFTATTQVDNGSILTEIATESDAVMVAALTRPQTELVRLNIDVDVSRAGSELYLFTLEGRQVSPAARSIIQDLRASYNRLIGNPVNSGQAMAEGT